MKNTFSTFFRLKGEDYQMLYHPHGEGLRENQVYYEDCTVLLNKLISLVGYEEGITFPHIPGLKGKATLLGFEYDGKIYGKIPVNSTFIM